MRKRKPLSRRARRLNRRFPRLRSKPSLLHTLQEARARPFSRTIAVNAIRLGQAAKVLCHKHLLCGRFTSNTQSTNWNKVLVKAWVRSTVTCRKFNFHPIRLQQFSIISAASRALILPRAHAPQSLAKRRHEAGLAGGWLGRFTTDAVKGMMAKPENREEAVSNLFERVGGRLLGWYLTFGPHDWLVIGEFPDNKAAAAAILAAAGGGSLSDIETTIAMTAEDAKATFEAAGTAARAFRSAGRP